MKNETFFITGASGFVGSCLLRKLVEKGQKNIHILLRPSAKHWRIQDLIPHCHVHNIDLMDKKALTKTAKKINPSVIYHLAAYGAYPFQTEAQRILETNLMGTLNLLEATRAIPYRLFVNTGSSSEYGFKSQSMRETDLPVPASYYAVSKVATTNLCSYFAKSEKKPVVTFRLFSVYGPYEEPSRLIPTLLESLRASKPMHLVSPRISRDMIYVDDVIDAYLTISRLSKHKGECFNIGTGIQSSMKSIVDAAIQATNRKTKFQWNTMKQRIWDTNVWVCDPSKMNTLTQWTAKTSLIEGLQKNWEWFETHYQLYKDKQS